MNALSYIRQNAAMLGQSHSTGLREAGWRHTTGYDPSRVCLYAERHEDTVVLAFDGGVIVRLHHEQDCCETVELIDVCGDLSDLVGHVLPVLDIRTQHGDDSSSDSETWTFVTLRGPMGSVDLRWYGTSNGYYSEEVNVEYWAPATDLNISAHQLLAFRAGKETP